MEATHIAEFVGTFVFLSSILRASGSNAIFQLAAGLTLCAHIIGGISGGHMNPVCLFFGQCVGRSSGRCTCQLCVFISIS